MLRVEFRHSLQHHKITDCVAKGELGDAGDVLEIEVFGGLPTRADEFIARVVFPSITHETPPSTCDRKILSWLVLNGVSQVQLDSSPRMFHTDLPCLV